MRRAKELDKSLHPRVPQYLLGGMPLFRTEAFRGTAKPAQRGFAPGVSTDTPEFFVTGALQALRHQSVQLRISFYVISGGACYPGPQHFLSYIFERVSQILHGLRGGDGPKSLHGRRHGRILSCVVHSCLHLWVGHRKDEAQGVPSKPAHRIFII